MFLIRIAAILLISASALPSNAQASPRIRWRDLAASQDVFSLHKELRGARVYCVLKTSGYRASFLRKKPGSRKQRQYRPINKQIDLLAGRSFAQGSKEYDKATQRLARLSEACDTIAHSSNPTPTATPSTPTPIPTPGGENHGFVLTGNPESLAPYAGPWTGRHVSHLLTKAGLGGSRELFEYGLAHGRAALVAKLLEPVPGGDDLGGVETLAHGIDNHAYEMAKAGAFTATGDVCKTYKLFAGKAARYYDYAYATKDGALAAYMNYLIQDHFSVNLDQTLDTNLCTRAYGTKVYVDSLRSHALGSFRELLFNFVRLDIMMNGWLDNTQNRSIAINENFARELMELYTHGICPRDGSDCTLAQNFYEPSVREMARALTGFVTTSVTGAHQFPDNYFWNWDGTTPQQLIAFTANTNYYDSGLKTLYEGTPYQTAALNFTTTWSWDDSRGDTSVRTAQSIPALDYVLSLDATREQLAHKLFSQLAYPNPGAALTAQLAQNLAESDYDLSKLVEVILNSEAFFSPLTKDAYITSPFENIVTFLRVTGINAALLTGSHYAILDAALNKASNQPLAPPDVFGFRGGGVNRQPGEDNRGEIWLSAQSLLARQNALIQLTDAVAFGQDYSFDNFIPSASKSAAQVLDEALVRFNVDLNPAQYDRLISFLNDGTSFESLTPAQRQMRMAGLANILSNTLSLMLK